MFEVAQKARGLGNGNVIWDFEDENFVQCAFCIRILFDF